MFGLFFGDGYQDQGGGGGNLVLDGVDVGKFTGPLEFIPTPELTAANSPMDGGFDTYRVWLEFLEFDSGASFDNVMSVHYLTGPTADTRPP